MQKLNGCYQHLLAIYNLDIVVDKELGPNLGTGLDFNRIDTHYWTFEEVHCILGCLLIELVALLSYQLSLVLIFLTYLWTIFLFP